jgi:hypothetical protein
MITNVAKNITCQSGITGWTKAVSIMLTERAKLLTKISVYFTPGSSNQVGIQIRKGGTMLLPDPTIFRSDPTPAYGDFVTGDDMVVDFYFETEIKQSETLEVFYRNTDAISTHDVMILFEFKTLPTVKSQLRS